MRTKMSEESTSSSSNNAVIEKMQTLFKEILQIQKENKNSDKDMQRIQEIISESGKTVENSTSPNEIMLDARILHNGAYFVNSNVASLNTNLTTFSESNYIEGVLSYIETPTHRENWKSLAPATFHLFRKTHPLNFMLGTITLEPPPPKTKTKVERHKKAQEASKNVLTSVKNKDMPTEDSSNIYDHMFRCLKVQFKKNQKRPISYFNFIIDPTSYWRTVENIFHFAFLVRDGIVKMEILKGLPFVRPVKEDEEEGRGEAVRNHQFCCTLSVADWKKCIEKFQISSPGIPPYVKKS